MISRRILAGILSLFLLTFCFASTPQKSSVAIASDELYTSLENLKMAPKKQLLLNSLSESFPYNIIIPFKTQFSDNYEQSVSILISQEYAHLYFDSLTDIFSYLSDTNVDRPCINFVFTATDESIENLFEGTRTYLNSIQQKNNNFILCLDYSIETSNKYKDFSNLIITPGGRTENGTGTVCPSSVLKTAIDSSKNVLLPFSIKGNFLSLYRLGFINTSKRLSYILQEGFPAIALSLNNNTENSVFKFLRSFSTQIKHWDNSITDIHYTILNLPYHTIFLTENTYITLLLISAAIVLLLAFGFSFMIGADSSIHKNEFLQTWPIIPISILLTTIFIIWAQQLTNLLIPIDSANIYLIVILKTIFTLLFIVLLSFFQHFFKLPITGYIYGFLLTLVSLMNIFIFAAVDLPLTLLFLIEYIIIYITRNIKSFFGIFFILICMALPFAPLIVNGFTFSDTYSQNLLRITPFHIIFLITWVIVPFEIMLIRFAIRLETWSHYSSKPIKKIIFRSSVVLLSLVTIAIVSIVVASKFPPKTINSKTETITNKDLLSLNINQTNLFNRSFSNLEVSSHLPVLRYKIVMKSKNPIPIYEANYPYDTLTEPYIATFNLDEYPPEPLYLNFTYDNNYKVECTVIAYYQLDNQIITQTSQIIFPKKISEGE